MNANRVKLSGVIASVAMMFFGSALTSAVAGDATDSPGQWSSSDYKFAKAAASGGTFEVNLGKIAGDRSTNSSVQQFGQRMVTDHGKAGVDLQQLATRKGAMLPSEPTGEQQKEIDKVSKLSGPEFDKAYIALMVKAHKADEKAFKKASEDADDPDLKSFANTTLGMVQAHLQMAEDLEKGLKQTSLSMNQ